MSSPFTPPSPQTVRLRRSFSLIFWGLLLVLLDFKINSVDLLPDSLGFLLAAIGAHGLRERSNRFGIACGLSAMLAMGSLAGWLLEKELVAALFLVMPLVNCSFYWQLLGGIRELANAQSQTALARQAQSRRQAYVAVMIAVAMVGWALRGSTDLLVVLPLVIAGLTVAVLALQVVHRAGRLLT